MFETLETTVDRAIGRIWLNRPDKLNPLSTLTLQELARAADWFNTQPDIRAVVIGGRGRCFSAGADLNSFTGSRIEDLREAADAGRLMADAIEDMQAITVARVQGWCVGGGLVLAAACDLRVAADSCQFSIPEVALGIPLAWGGIPRLVREIGPALCKELVITCRPFDAAEAHAAGFLNRVVAEGELDNAVDTLVAQVVDKPGFPVWATKRHVDAVTSQMVGTDRSWGDADALVSASVDPECVAARDAYVARQLGGEK
jgi:enoyl-CoA hydratase/carnithine racemase